MRPSGECVLPVNAIERREVEARFTLLTRNHGWAIGNQVISLLRSTKTGIAYRRAMEPSESAGRVTSGRR